MKTNREYMLRQIAGESILIPTGTASQKYTIWQESVTASQNRLVAALQSFYSLLDAEWMKDFYEGRAGLVETFTAGTEAMDGWNLKLSVIIASVTALIAVVYKLSTAIKTAYSV